MVIGSENLAGLGIEEAYRAEGEGISDDDRVPSHMH